MSAMSHLFRFKEEERSARVYRFNFNQRHFLIFFLCCISSSPILAATTRIRRRRSLRLPPLLTDSEERIIRQLFSTPLLVEDDKPSKEVEESVKVLKDVAKTRKVAAEKVLNNSGDDESVGTNRRKKDSAKKRKFADFQKEEHEARNKVPNSDKLSLKRIDSATFEVHVKQRRSKEERSALAKVGREDRGKYLPRKAANQKKVLVPYCLGVRNMRKPNVLNWSLIIICIPDKGDESGPIILHLDSLSLHSSRSLFDNIKRLG
ncbi:hypothetical protein S83_038784 [Arachis hypogaea]